MAYTGIYERTIFYNPVNKYSVISVKTSDRSIPEKARSAYRHRDNMIHFAAVGYELPRTDQVSMILDGEWKEGKNGFQLHVTKCEEVVPQTREGIKGYLSSRLIKGIGGKTAELIVDRFGADTLHVLENEPERLLEIRGVSKAKLEEIIASYMMAGLSGWMVNQAQIEAAIGNGTITRAKTVGEVMATYKTENTTENFYAYLAKHSSLKCQAVCRGKITKVETKTAGGFDYGTATVAGEDGSTYMVLFQNENLVIYKDGIVVMTAPDIISFYEINAGMPLTNADTKEGQYVDIGIIEVDERWWKNGEAAINDVWAPYFKNVEYTGRIVRYPAK